MYQTTLNKEFYFCGVGLHSGQQMDVRVLPAAENTGIQFRRVDVVNCEYARVTPFNVGSTQLATTIKCGDFPISTIEHLVSALYGLGVDNAYIDVKGPEIPILDGSAGPIVALIMDSGIEVQAARRKYLTFTRDIKVELDDKFIQASPHNASLDVMLEIEYPHAAINYQKKSITLNPDLYMQCIANSRTFGFQKDVEMLWKMGLAKGGSMENAIVLDDKDGILNPEGLRNKEEFINHKLLDLIGDISLVGYRINGSLHALKSGHNINNIFARKVLENANGYRLVELENTDCAYGYLCGNPV